MNIPQTSASGRIEAAQKAIEIAVVEANSLSFYRENLALMVRPEGFVASDGERYEIDAVDRNMRRAIEGLDIVADALRALITPPPTGTIARIYARQAMRSEAIGRLVPDEQVEALIAEAYHAGIQDAHESWEPADHPSQEMMLRWLGIDYGDSAFESDKIFIESQLIEREVI